MVSKLWWNLILWGLGDRLDQKADYKTDLLLVLDLIAWYSLLSLSIRSGANLLLLWFLAPLVNTPLIWIVTQFAVGYMMVRKAKPRVVMKKALNQREVVSSPVGASESEEP